jgi:hypothetical protein
VAVSDFDDLVDDAEHVPIEGWDFGWLDGRAVEERPTWRYFDRVVERAADVSTLLEIQAGVGSGREACVASEAVGGDGGLPAECRQGCTAAAIEGRAPRRHVRDTPSTAIRRRDLRARDQPSPDRGLVA